jgi:hypothetical protein
MINGSAKYIFDGDGVTLLVDASLKSELILFHPVANCLNVFDTGSYANTKNGYHEAIETKMLSVRSFSDCDVLNEICFQDTILFFTILTQLEISEF